MTNGKRNRQAGHNWERQLAEVFRSIGFPYVVTTRSESKSRDDQKVDLMNRDEAKNGRFPFNVQAKSATTNLPYARLLAEMPNDRGIINLIMHKQTGKTENGQNFVTRGKYVMLNLNDFIDILRMAYEPKVVKKRVARAAKGSVGATIHGKAQGEAGRGIQSGKSVAETRGDIHSVEPDTSWRSESGNPRSGSLS